MKNFVNLVEKYLIRFAVFSLLVMVLVQGLMTSDPIRFYLSWGERMEGQTIEFPVNANDPAASQGNAKKMGKAYLTISTGKYPSLPQTAVKLNGEKKYFLQNHLTEIEVDAGDTIAIDSSYYRFPVDYEIIASSNNIAYPCRGQIFTAKQSVVRIGTVIVK